MVAKYQANIGDHKDSESCELCGKESDGLEPVLVSGATLRACWSCRRHMDGEKVEDSGQQDSTPGYTISSNQDSSWVEDVEYSRDRTPYMVKGYSEILEEKMEEESLTVSDVTEQADVEERDVQAILNGEAASYGVGGEAVKKIEESLGIEIIDS